MSAPTKAGDITHDIYRLVRWLPRAIKRRPSVDGLTRADQSTILLPLLCSGPWSIPSCIVRPRVGNGIVFRSSLAACVSEQGQCMPVAERYDLCPTYFEGGGVGHSEIIQKRASSKSLHHQRFQPALPCGVLLSMRCEEYRLNVRGQLELCGLRSMLNQQRLRETPKPIQPYACLKTAVNSAARHNGSRGIYNF